MNYDSDSTTLLSKTGKATMEVKRLKIVGIEIFKTVNNLNLTQINDIFHRSVAVTQKKIWNYESQESI